MLLFFFVGSLYEIDQSINVYVSDCDEIGLQSNAMCAIYNENFVNLVGRAATQGSAIEILNSQTTHIATALE